MHSSLQGNSVAIQTSLKPEEESST